MHILINAAESTDQWTRARQAAATALQLDPNLGEAHAVAAMAELQRIGFPIDAGAGRPVGERLNAAPGG